MGDFNLVVHHGGVLIKAPLEYVGGALEEVGLVDIDRWSFQELRALMRELGYKKECIFQWLSTGDYKLILINNDNMAMCMAMSSVDTLDKTAHVYCEHDDEDLRDVAKEGEKEKEASIDRKRELPVQHNEGSDSDESYVPIAESDSDVDEDNFDLYYYAVLYSVNSLHNHLITPNHWK